MIWDVLNKIAIIGTILGIPATLYGIYSLPYRTIVLYDRYREPNEAGSNTLVIGEFTRNDARRGKKKNSERRYHLKGRNDDAINWI